MGGFRDPRAHVSMSVWDRSVQLIRRGGTGSKGKPIGFETRDRPNNHPRWNPSSVLVPTEWKGGGRSNTSMCTKKRRESVQGRKGRMGVPRNRNTKVCHGRNRWPSEGGSPPPILQGTKGPSSRRCSKQGLRERRRKPTSFPNRPRSTSSHMHCKQGSHSTKCEKKWTFMDLGEEALSNESMRQSCK